MSQPAKKELISLELQQTIEKLESILAQIKSTSKQNQPPVSLINRLVNTTEDYQSTISKGTFAKYRSFYLAIFVLVLVLAVGIGFYFYNPTSIKSISSLSSTPNAESVKIDDFTTIENSIEDQINLPLPEEIESEKNEQIFLENLPLNPEQTLLTGIKQSLSSYTNQLQEKLISSVRVDFASSLLEVILTEDWYELNKIQQNRLAEDIWQNAQNLAFSKIELHDKKGNILARNPVVGNSVVILQRKPLS